MKNISLKVEQAIEDLQNGKMIILVDSKDRENEGDLVCLADRISKKQLDFMTRFGRGLICVAIDHSIAHRLDLHTVKGSSPHNTPFAQSVDINNKGSGISINDRHETIKHIASTNSRNMDFVTPGHIFPLVAHSDGIFARQGHTEASVLLAQLAGARPASVICEVLSEGYGMSAGKELEEFAFKHDIHMLHITDLLAYMYRPLSRTKLQTPYGEVILKTYPQYRCDTNSSNGYVSNEPVFSLEALDFASDKKVHVRIHSECLTGDLLGSLHCDCGGQLQESIRMLFTHNGLLIYLRQEGRGIGLVEKMKAYNLQALGVDTYDANTELGHNPDMRTYDQAVMILKNRSINNVVLLSNNPDKIAAIKDAGIKCRQKSLEVESSLFSADYLKTKKDRFGHLLSKVGIV